MILWTWWLEMWLAWLTVVEVTAAPQTPPTKPSNVVDLDRWRHDHPPGRAA
jgi:hypothetical protein